MPTLKTTFRTVPDTAAALGVSGAHSLVADRPAGVARGSGLGFNGAQLLASAVGGCLYNDIQYLAHAEGVELAELSIDVDIDLAGDPVAVVGLAVAVTVSPPEATELVQRAAAVSAILAAVRGGVNITLRAGTST